MTFHRKTIAAAIATLFLTGCATFSQDGGFGEVQKLAGTELKWQRNADDAASVQAEVKRRLAQPLTADDAVQIALLNNPGLQASYAELGIAEADLVQAGRIGNPRYSYMRVKHGDERKLEWALTFPIMDLLTMNMRQKIEGRRFEQAFRQTLAARGEHGEMSPRPDLFDVGDVA